MIELFAIEYLRFKRNPLNFWITGIFLGIMLLMSLGSGLAARDFRVAATQPLVPLQASNQAEMHDAPKNNSDENKPSAVTASAALDPLRLPALGGLVLSVRQMDFFSTAIKVSTRSRYTDGRTSDQLFNPVLHELGLLDFAGVVALLTPLVIIAFTYGCVLEERELGIWRLIATQIDKPWHLLLATLSVRYLVVFIAISLSSVLAFVLDPEASIIALGYWLMLISCFILIWFCLAALFMLSRLTSGAATLGMLGTWLFLTFAVPALLSWAANSNMPMPSRLTSIISIRQSQEHANQQRQTLLENWFAAHPELTAPKPISQLPREIAGLPATLLIDAEVRPIMLTFEEVRKQQFEFMQHWTFVSPGLAVVFLADRLAGIDAPRYSTFINDINQFEDQWRDYFVPRIMTEQPWSDADQHQQPTFSMPQQQDNLACWQLLGTQSLLAILLLSLVYGLRHRLTVH